MPVSRRLAALPRRLLGLLSPDIQTGVRARFGRARPWELGARIPPPACPPGMVVGAPDFVGVGVQKAGTSWWLAMIRRHPDVYLHPGAHKERHFFKDHWQEPFTEADAATYASWFPRPAGKQTGEWTPDYLAQPWSIELLRRAAPHARLLVLLRDPIDRLVSGITHEVSRGTVLRQAQLHAALDRGRYASQLSRLFGHFPRDQVLLLQYERCKARPGEEFARTLRFLGLPEFIPGSFSKLHNRTPVAKVRLSPAFVEGARREYARDVRELGGLWPELDLSLWRHFSEGRQAASGAAREGA